MITVSITADGLHTPVVNMSNTYASDVSVVYWLTRADIGIVGHKTEIPVVAGTTETFDLTDAEPTRYYTFHWFWTYGGTDHESTVSIDYTNTADYITIPDTFTFDTNYWDGTGIQIPYTLTVLGERKSIILKLKVHGDREGVIGYTIVDTTDPVREWGVYSGYIPLGFAEQRNILYALGTQTQASVTVSLEELSITNVSLTRDCMNSVFKSSEASAPVITAVTYQPYNADPEILQNHTPLKLTAVTVSLSGRVENSVQNYQIDTDRGRWSSSSLPLSTSGNFSLTSGNKNLIVTVEDVRGYKGTFTEVVPVTAWNKPEILSFTAVRDSLDPSKLDVEIKGRFTPVIIGGVVTNYLQYGHGYYGDPDSPATSFSVDTANAVYVNDIFTITQTVNAGMSSTATYGAKIGDVYDGIDSSVPTEIVRIPPLDGYLYFRDEGIGIGAVPTNDCNRGLEITDSNSNFCRLPDDLMLHETNVSLTIGSVTGTVKAYKRANVVEFTFNLGNSTGTPFSTLTGVDTIGTMPVGWRPKTSVYACASFRDNGTWASANHFNGVVVISASGDISLRGKGTEVVGCKYVSTAVTYCIA